MPNIAQVLKEEIRRLAKKEAKALTTNLKKDVVKLKKSNVAMRRSVKQLQKDNTLLLNAEKRRQLNAPVIAPEASKARITSKGVKAMRKKLGLSQEEFGKLVKVCTVSVGRWEKKEGALGVRKNIRAAILALRGIGAKEAKRRLELVASKTEKKVKKIVKRAMKKAVKRVGKRAKGKRGKRAKK